MFSYEINILSLFSKPFGIFYSDDLEDKTSLCVLAASKIGPHLATSFDSSLTNGDISKYIYAKYNLYF